MIRPDGRLARQRRDRLGHAPRPSATASGERKPFDRPIEELRRLLRPRGALELELLTPYSDSEAHGLRGLARRSRELCSPRPRHGDDQVESVEESPRELVAKRGQSLL